MTEDYSLIIKYKVKTKCKGNYSTERGLFVNLENKEQYFKFVKFLKDDISKMIIDKAQELKGDK